MICLSDSELVVELFMVSAILDFSNDVVVGINGGGKSGKTPIEVMGEMEFEIVIMMLSFTVYVTHIFPCF